MMNNNDDNINNEDNTIINNTKDNNNETSTTESTAPETTGNVDAQEMTDAIYTAHAAINEVVMGGILNTTEGKDKDVSAEMTVDEEDVNMEKKNNNNESSTELSAEGTMNNGSVIQSTFVSPQLVKEQLKYCQRILKGLKRHREAGPFLLPVDPVALGIPDYFDVIKQPMDLGTISKKLDLNEYGTAEAFMSDVRLMLTNCFTYNAPDSQVTKMGRNIEKYFNTSMAKMPTDLSNSNTSASGLASSNSSSAIESPSSTSRPKRESVVSVSGAVTGGGNVRRPSSPSGSMTFCSAVLRELMKKTNSHLNWPFMLPVDPIALGIPDYFDVIKQPMDLGTIRKKLDTGMYGRPEQFESDVRLVFTNCYTYNPPESDVYRMAQQLEAIFDQKMSQKPANKPEKSHSTSTSASTNVSSSVTPTANSLAGSSSFIPSSASQLIPGLDALEDDSEKILAINHQIQILQAELNYLLLNRRSSSSASASVGSVNKSSGSLSGAANSVASGKPRKKSAAPSSSLHKPTATPTAAVIEEMSFEEKRQLSEDVSNLPQENMMRVLEIIQECMPNLHSNGDSDVIELDIEALDVRTLRTLQGYIWECNNPGKKRKSTGNVSKPTGGNNNNHKKAKEIDMGVNNSGNNNAGVNNAGVNNATTTTTTTNNNYDLSSSSSSEDDD